ncbi:hypothetical protein, partial [Nitratireductor sp. XY-223]|uniref:hypothetical protein n=1 Tax=Nitratireductor sp. XY-223 TaxID=2561926 RepID=UPI00197CF882
RKTVTVSFRQQIRRATATRPFKTRKSRPANEPCRQHDPDARCDATCGPTWFGEHVMRPL